jgi:hypothetical protein
MNGKKLKETFWRLAMDLTLAQTTFHVAPFMCAYIVNQQSSVKTNLYTRNRRAKFPKSRCQKCHSVSKPLPTTQVDPSIHMARRQTPTSHEGSRLPLTAPLCMPPLALRSPRKPAFAKSTWFPATARTKQRRSAKLQMQEHSKGSVDVAKDHRQPLNAPRCVLLLR